MGKYLYGNCPDPLPDIYTVYTPELQQQFPHAYITEIWTSYSAYQLFLTEKPLCFAHPIIEPDASFGYISSLGEEIVCKSFEVKTSDNNGWVEYYKTSVYGQSTHQPLWCNTDMKYYNYETVDGTTAYTDTGETALYKSTPIPVPTYDPTALSQGYLVGCRLRAQRRKQ